MHRQGNIRQECAACGTVFYTWNCVLKLGKGRYCGRECAKDTNGPARRPLAARFWPKIDMAGNCWLWTASTNKNGYGTIYTKGRPLLAHRVAWELARGPIPDGMDACHHCDNPPCVRPDHLFLGTAKDNVNDMWAKGRGHRPSLKTGVSTSVQRG